jgi:putative hydrolase of the HAD superfamily
MPENRLGRRPRCDVISLDAMGVIYVAGDDVGELLIPFLQEHGCPLGPQRIEAVYREASLGRLTEAGFWAAMGLGLEPEHLSHAYLQRHRVRPGLLEFLEQCQSAGIAVACVTNDLAGWSTILRRRHGLEAPIPTWIVSAEVGYRKPSPEIYDAFLASIRVPASRCLFVDDREANLDGASRAGMQPIRFGPPQINSKYPLVSQLSELLKLAVGVDG